MGCSETRVLQDAESRKKYSLENQYKMYGAIQGKNSKTYLELLEKGFYQDFRMPTFSMKAPIHIAAEFGSDFILQDLINKGCDVDIKDVNGVTPIFYAVRNKHVSCAVLLDLNGADLSIVSKQGLTIIDYIPKGKEKQYFRMFRGAIFERNSYT